MGRGRLLLATALALTPLATVLSCGARTPLLIPETFDAEPEVGLDRRDVARRDVVDALPPIDVQRVDVNRTDCPDADATLIYLVSQEGDLVSFYPPSATFKTIGKLSCPNATGSHPFSMGVDRKGVAYVLFSGDNFQDFKGLYRVSTATGACISTPFVTDTSVFPPEGLFGMGFSTEGAGPKENLYIMGTEGELGFVDLVGNKPLKLATTSPLLQAAELTGTGDGHLFAFFRDVNGDVGIADLDKASAKVLGSDLLPGIAMGTAWAFAAWGGAFYTFTAPGGGNTEVDKYDPVTKKTTAVTTYNGHIVGAGVSTCAPNQ